jgi:hypothetical protein
MYWATQTASKTTTTTNGANHQDQTWKQDHVQSVQPPTTNGVGEEQWDNSPGATSQNSESMDGANGIVPRRKRTKTGCMTCRRRKKKCDEERPFCNNCPRGRFTCEEYSTTRVTGQRHKTSATKPPLPPRSKGGQPSSARPYNGPQLRPAPSPDGAKPHQYATAPASEPTSRPPYPGQPRPPQQGQPQYTKDHVPPLTEINRADVSAAAPPREMSRPPTQGTGGAGCIVSCQCSVASLPVVLESWIEVIVSGIAKHARSFHLFDCKGLCS